MLVAETQDYLIESRIFAPFEKLINTYKGSSFVGSC